MPKKTASGKTISRGFVCVAEKIRDEKMVPEGRKTMKGVNYYLNHEKQFLEVLNHTNIPLDNNATESALRNFCMHKHTWRLIDTINGVKASA